MNLDYTGPYIMITLLLSTVFFFLGLTGFTNPQLFKRKNSLKVPNRFVLLLIFFLISIGFLITAVGLFATQIHKRKLAYHESKQVL